MKKIKKTIIAISICLISFLLILTFSILINDSMENKIGKYLNNFDKNNHVVMTLDDKIFFDDHTLSLEYYVSDSSFYSTLYIDNDEIYFCTFNWEDKGYNVDVYNYDINFQETKFIVNKFFESPHTMSRRVYMYDKKHIFFFNQANNVYVYNIVMQEFDTYENYTYENFPFDTFLKNDNLFSYQQNGNELTIINNSTGNNKIISQKNLKMNCELKKFSFVNYKNIYCKDDNIYIAFNSMQYVIVYKYNFDDESMEFYAWNDVKVDASKSKIFFLN